MVRPADRDSNPAHPVPCPKFGSRPLEGHFEPPQKELLKVPKSMSTLVLKKAIRVHVGSFGPFEMDVVEAKSMISTLQVSLFFIKNSIFDGPDRAFPPMIEI